MLLLVFDYYLRLILFFATASGGDCFFFVWHLVLFFVYLEGKNGCDPPNPPYVYRKYVVRQAYCGRGVFVSPTGSVSDPVVSVQIVVVVFFMKGDSVVFLLCTSLCRLGLRRQKRVCRW